jgi:hypothetical protein
MIVAIAMLAIGLLRFMRSMKKIAQDLSKLIGGDRVSSDADAALA